MRNTGTTTRTNRRKKIFKHNKSFFGKAKNCYTIAIRQYKKSLAKRYISAKLLKRDMRRKWIDNINKYLRWLGESMKVPTKLNYSTFIGVLPSVNLNRKIVSDMIDNNVDIKEIIIKAYPNKSLSF